MQPHSALVDLELLKEGRRYINEIYKYSKDLVKF